MRRGRRKSAFTLIELLVVVVIIAILMALLLPAMARARFNAKRTQATQKARTFENAVRAFHHEYGYFPVHSGSRASGGVWSNSHAEIMGYLRPSGNERAISFWDESGDNLESPFAGLLQYMVIIDVTNNEVRVTGRNPDEEDKYMLDNT